MPSKTDGHAKRSTFRRVVLDEADQFVMPHPDQHRADRGEQFLVIVAVESVVQEWTTRNGVREYDRDEYSVTLKGPVLTKNGRAHATQGAEALYGDGLWGKQLHRLPERIKEYLIEKDGMIK